MTKSRGTRTGGVAGDETHTGMHTGAAPGARTRTPSADMRDALLSSAADLLEREGPDALSVRRIAAAAGVAPMGVYNHFDSKNGIIEALFVQGFERLRDALTAISDIQDPYEALREGGRRYRALALAHPKVYELMFLHTIPAFEPSDAALEIAARAFDSLVAAVMRAMAAGVLAVGPPTETAQVIWSSIHGWVSLELMGIGFVEDQDAGFDLGCRSLLRGLRP
ncbi:MAG TPA: TetR/AcrR family transcriptional regulator [Acidimicrobiales bacterium]|nr:TetR/AcrR family transcriptional regulator [Acidimicrobiales bacterium]